MVIWQGLRNTCYSVVVKAERWLVPCDARHVCEVGEVTACAVLVLWSIHFPTKRIAAGERTDGNNYNTHNTSNAQSSRRRWVLNSSLQVGHFYLSSIYHQCGISNLRVYIISCLKKWPCNWFTWVYNRQIQHNKTLVLLIKWYIHYLFMVK